MLLEHLLKVSYLFLSIYFWLAGANHKITWWGPWTYFKQMFIFDGAKINEAKSFARHLIKPENLSRYVEGSQGRYLPVSISILENPFWNELRNTHIQASRETVNNYKLAYQIYNPAYTEVRRQNIWAQAIQQVCENGIPVERAVDNAIDSIESIFKKWERS